MGNEITTIHVHSTPIHHYHTYCVYTAFHRMSYSLPVCRSGISQGKNQDNSPYMGGYAISSLPQYIFIIGSVNTSTAHFISYSFVFLNNIHLKDTIMSITM